MKISSRSWEGTVHRTPPRMGEAVKAMQLATRNYYGFPKGFEPIIYAPETDIGHPPSRRKFLLDLHRDKDVMVEGKICYVRV